MYFSVDILKYGVFRPDRLCASRNEDEAEDRVTYRWLNI